MTLFMPPIQRKKKVVEKYNPDSYRVISEDAVSDHPKYRPLSYRASFEPPTPVPKQFNNNADDAAESVWFESPRPLKNTRVLPQILPDYRANKPQAKSCGFLDRNVRFLNEPICNVYTRPVQHEEKYWWPTRANPGELEVPPYTEDSNYRSDFHCRFGPRSHGSGRHTAHIGQEAALGAVPVNYLRERDGSQRFYKEGMSYEHQYNSRLDPNYPIRGKRHGAFVWNRMDPISQKKFIEYYEKLHEEERKLKQEGELKPSSPGEKSNNGDGVFVARSVNSNNNTSGTSSPKRRGSSQQNTKSVTLPAPEELMTAPCDEQSKITEESSAKESPQQQEPEQIKQSSEEDAPVTESENKS